MATLEDEFDHHVAYEQEERLAGRYHELFDAMCAAGTTHGGEIIEALDNALTMPAESTVLE